MNRYERVRKRLIVEPGSPAGLAERDPAWPGGKEYEELSAKKLKAEAKKILSQGVEDLAEAQELLWASDTYALLVVFQAIDAAGKDSTIEHVMSGVNPQGVQVVSFKQPSSEELDHDFLWRISKALPERGRIGIFNRSHYEEVVALQVHPEWLEAQTAPAGTARKPVLEGAVRRHQRLRAPPRPQRDEDREVLPPRLQGGAEAALPRPPREARQGVEVQRGRRRRARAIGTPTRRRSRTRSRRPRRRGPPGTSSRPTTSR